MTLYHLEDRIRRLRAALNEIARGDLGLLSTAKFARETLDSDDKLAERYRTDVCGGED